MESLFKLDLPLRLPHKELANALFGTSEPTEAEKEWHAFFTANGKPAISNLWTKTDTPLVYEQDDFGGGIEEIEKVLRPATTADGSFVGNAFSKAMASENFSETLNEEFTANKYEFAAFEKRSAAGSVDWDEEIFSTPSTPEAKERHSKPKNTAEEIDDAELDQATMDAAIEACLPSADSESTADFLSRVDAKLKELGRQPVLSMV